MIADLRSDTVTKPSPGMLDAMMSAKVGDDVFGDDPTINELENLACNLLGMEAAVFCPSGTMTNQIGINILTKPFEEIICYKGAHIYKYEGGGLAGNSQLSVRLLDGNRGRLSAENILANINNAADPHQPITSLVAIENTIVREAGAYYSLELLKTISETVHDKGLHLHLDGARLFNALTETNDKPSDIGPLFDTVSICLSKGLGAPVGSLILCKKNKEAQARRRRKSLGGGMRQAGFLAAAGIYALKNNIPGLKEDHRRAKILAKELANITWIKGMMPVDTNIIIFETADKLTPAQVLEKLALKNIRAVAFGPNQIRMVTHLDFTEAHLDMTVNALKSIHL